MKKTAFFCFTRTVVPSGLIHPSIRLFYFIFFFFSFLFCCYQNRVTFSTTSSVARLCLHKLVYILLTVPLASTVAEVTGWCGIKSVDIESRAVPHSSICVERTANANPVKTDLTTDSTFLHCRMAPAQPTSSMCATLVCWDTKLRHLCACRPLEAVPA